MEKVYSFDVKGEIYMIIISLEDKGKKSLIIISQMTMIVIYRFMTTWSRNLIKTLCDISDVY